MTSGETGKINKKNQGTVQPNRATKQRPVECGIWEPHVAVGTPWKRKLGTALSLLAVQLQAVGSHLLVKIKRNYRFCDLPWLAVACLTQLLN